MKSTKPNFFAIVLVTLLSAVGSAEAAGVHWSGASIDFTNPANAESVDVLIAGGLEITRSAGGAGLFNSALESGYDRSSPSTSPAGTLWAVSGLNANPVFSFGEGQEMGAGLTFLDWRSAFGGPGLLLANILNAPAVIKIPGTSAAQDIYVDIVFTQWGGPGAGGSFAYTRSSPVPLPGALPLIGAALFVVAGRGLRRARS